MSCEYLQLLKPTSDTLTDSLYKPAAQNELTLLPDAAIGSEQFLERLSGLFLDF